MKIVLLGYMGSGKTTVGKLLSKNLTMSFIDLDQYIEASEKMTITELFKKKGELYFRKKEYEYLKEIILKKNNFILSTGGGTPCYGDNMNTIVTETNNNFYLKMSLPSLVERLTNEKEHRPLIKDTPNEAMTEFIGKHLFERSFYYNKAKHMVTCDAQTPELIVEAIKKKLS